MTAADRPTTDAASEPVAGTLSLSLSLAASVERLRELRERATPGPWGTEYGGQNWWIASCGMGEDDMTVWSPNPPTPDHGGEREDDGGEADRANSRFIAAAGSLSWDSLAAALTELAGVRAALRTAYDDMDAACRWAATQTRGMTTIEQADEHMAGYDALLAGTVRAGLAAGVLHDFAAEAALSPTPMPPMPPTPSVPTKEETPDE